MPASIDSAPVFGRSATWGIVGTEISLRLPVALRLRGWWEMALRHSQVRVLSVVRLSNSASLYAPSPSLDRQQDLPPVTTAHHFVARRSYVSGALSTLDTETGGLAPASRRISKLCSISGGTSSRARILLMRRRSRSDFAAASRSRRISRTFVIHGNSSERLSNSDIGL